MLYTCLNQNSPLVNTLLQYCFAPAHHLPCDITLECIATICQGQKLTKPWIFCTDATLVYLGKAGAYDL